MGKHGNQTPEFWNSMFSFIELVRTDHVEVYNILKFIMNNLELPSFANLQETVIKVVTVLFLGLFYAELTDPFEDEILKQEQQVINQKISDFLMANNQMVNKIVSGSNAFVQKNFQIYINTLKKWL